jgi:hypothetical protein
MARQPKVWLRRQPGEFMTTIQGTQPKLGKDRKEAEKAFHALMLQDSPAVRSRPLFRNLADAFLAQSQPVNSPGTLAIHRHLSGEAT